MLVVLCDILVRFSGRSCATRKYMSTFVSWRKLYQGVRESLLWATIWDLLSVDLYGKYLLHFYELSRWHCMRDDCGPWWHVHGTFQTISVAFRDVRYFMSDNCGTSILYSLRLRCFFLIHQARCGKRYLRLFGRFQCQFTRNIKQLHEQRH